MKKRSYARKTRKPIRGDIMVMLILLLVILFSVILAGGFFQVGRNLPGNDIYIPVPFSPDTSKNNLQLYTLKFTRLTSAPPSTTPFPTTPFPTTPAGTPPPFNQQACLDQQNKDLTGPVLRWGTAPDGSKCVMDGPAMSLAQCCPGVGTCENPNPGSACSRTPGGDACPEWCDAKPIIYLYPQKPMNVSVSLKVPGKVVMSDPIYPQNGWENIFAQPNGTFTYNGKTYHELFYEASIIPTTPPTTGIVVPTSDIRKTLEDITTKLGLNQTEQEEFLQYWTPRLQDLHGPYMLISVFSSSVKDRIDHVDITPRPDTFIQFIMYYKPLQKSITVTPLVLPQTVPQRNGFTAVEWGGIIDH